ncbi:hypothetical protein EAG18_09445 [Pseudoalteromonas sp. J010]|uniref:hypothetical protein n=1 Tax=Pseudoalteromonas sp. J010 TaxID=998465 RepID=UPI000F64D237|nr:hypothetical protein [Pseudoalteromonas sp. J010]RRS08911.1 hypothetical protein EAG18_09445 [Pseudoalteromonas sp. J010]
MYKLMMAVSVLALVTACSEQSQPEQKAAPAVQEATDSLSMYKTQAEALLANIRVEKEDKALEAQSAELVNLSRTLLNEFVAKYPQCQTYLDALDKAADIIPTLPLEEIESGYHADGKLPKFDDPVCYHAKDLLVHPATVQAIAMNGFKGPEDYKSAEMEIVEVIAHFDQVERALK